MKFRTRAAVAPAPRAQFVFRDVDLDMPRTNEVIVRIVGCGICHTDLSARDGLYGMFFPAVFGHEGAGIVERVGKGVKRVRPGDRVVISFGSCGKCSSCSSGHPAHCAAFDELNFGSTRRDGSFSIHDPEGDPIGCCFFSQSSLAFHALTGERNLVPVDAADDDELALFAPLACGMQAGAGTVLNELKPGPGESFAVFGAGTVGLSALMAARMSGASPLVAVDVVDSRLELARELGATHVLNARGQRIAKRLGELVGLIDHAIDTTGIPRIMNQALASLAPSGRMSVMGGSSEDDEPEPYSPHSPGPGQRTIYSIAGDSNPQTFIPYMIERYRQGRFPFHRLIKEYPAEDINRAIGDAVAGSTIKPLLRFDRP